MKTQLPGLFLSLLALAACNGPTQEKQEAKTAPLQGTWKLLSGTLIEKGDTTVTDYTKGVSFIKIINESHFAFLNHDLNKGKDSTASFSAGGGTYTLKDSAYTEKLEYCTAREWEGNEFHFTVSIQNDTLVQQGVEKVEAAGVERLNIEKYVRVK
ncbi:hypothetical protein GCM10010967_44540 [Dyadobacter beijingensis]|uniref:Lipocalin-like domain-containing protein n=1 Tax=Dyadobacter beijingensis TaxID=365489 RepID=A0ABQ2IDJ2_9BACT|nr:hypothetical protein [Dyadobacter beijingensis]GGN04643.1 hypothetical protein GCM10010967_44540 [Dyadobacter beijingensis]